MSSKFTKPAENITPILSIVEDDDLLQLLDSYTPYILNKMKKKGLLHEKDDLISDITLIMISRFQESIIEYPVGYLLRVVNNVIADYCKKRASRLKAFPQNTCLEDCSHMAAEDEFLLLEDEEEQQVKVEQILAIINRRLSPVDGSILKKRFLYKKTYAELAEEFGLNEPNVRKIVSRSKKRVKEIYFQQRS